MALYSRQNPSPRYSQLIKLYRQMHEEGERFLKIPPDRVFPGTSLPPHLETIKSMIVRHEAKTVLDYGSGKGKQYKDRSALPDGSTGMVKDYWGLDSVTCYDPAYMPLSQLPSGKFDGVISTDVLEHCPEEDLSWILDEMFSYARKFVFVNVACFPAFKRLPNGENAHCTVNNRVWWNRVIETVAAKYPALECKAIFDESAMTSDERVPFWRKVSQHVKERSLPDRLKRLLSPSE